MGRRANGEVVTVDVSALVDAITEGVEEKIRDAAKNWDPSADEVREVIDNNCWTLDDVGFDLSQIDLSEIVSEHGLGDLVGATIDYHGVQDTLDEVASVMNDGWAGVMKRANNEGDHGDRAKFLRSLKGTDDGGLLAYTADAFALLDGNDQHTFLSSENVRREYEKMGVAAPTQPETPAKPTFTIDLPPEADMDSPAYTARGRADFLTGVVLDDVRVNSVDGPQGLARVVWDALTPVERGALMAHVFSTLVTK